MTLKKVTAALHIIYVWVLSRTRKLEWDMVYQIVVSSKNYVHNDNIVIIEEKFCTKTIVQIPAIAF